MMTSLRSSYTMIHHFNYFLPTGPHLPLFSYIIRKKITKTDAKILKEIFSNTVW